MCNRARSIHGETRKPGVARIRGRDDPEATGRLYGSHGPRDATNAAGAEVQFRFRDSCWFASPCGSREYKLICVEWAFSVLQCAGGGLEAGRYGKMAAHVADNQPVPLCVSMEIDLGAICGTRKERDMVLEPSLFPSNRKFALRSVLVHCR